MADDAIAKRFTLHLGDCMDVIRAMPDRSVDVSIFDPPYSPHVHATQRKLGEKKDGKREILNTPLPFPPMTDELRDAFALEIARVTKRWVVSFCEFEATHQWRVAFEAGGLRWVRGGYWHKPDPTPQITGDRPGTGGETLVIMHQQKAGRMHWNGGGMPAFWSYTSKSAEREWIHPTEKPLALMLKLVSQFSDEGELVFDPFAGSGTTGVAAVRLMRRFVGCEIDPGFHLSASERLEAECLGLGLSDYKRGQQSLFGSLLAGEGT